MLYLCTRFQDNGALESRVVDYSSLENYRTERYRGFESLSLRKEFSTSLNSFFLLAYRFLICCLNNN